MLNRKQSSAALLPHAKQSVFPQQCDFCGFLDIRRQSTSSSKFKFRLMSSRMSWERKYTVLANNFLLMASTPYATKLELRIPLEGSHVSTHNSMTFEVMLNEQSYTFRAANDAVCKAWMKNIQRKKRLCVDDIYQRGAQLGSTSKSTVFAATQRTTGRMVAIKVMNKTNCNEQMLRNEVMILKRLDHPNVVQLLNIFNTKEEMYIVMERCEGGQLYDQIVALDGGRGFSEKQCLGVLQQISSAVHYMHEMGIVHRDLKPENILCVYKNSLECVKVADFGISEVVIEPKQHRAQNRNQSRKQTHDEEKRGSGRGSLAYVAPEILKARPYDESVDCWSIGVIAFTLLCGYPPFHGESRYEMRHSILYGNIMLDEEDWAHVSDSGKAMVLGLLERNPSMRLGLEDVLEQARMSKAKQTFSPKAAKQFRRTVAERCVRKAFSFEESEERASKADVKQKHDLSAPQSIESVTSSLASGCTAVSSMASSCMGSLCSISQTDDFLLNLVSSPRTLNSPAFVFSDHDDDDDVQIASPRRRKYSQ